MNSGESSMSKARGRSGKKGRVAPKDRITPLPVLDVDAAGIDICAAPP